MFSLSCKRISGTTTSSHTPETEPPETTITQMQHLFTRTLEKLNGDLSCLRNSLRGKNGTKTELERTKRELERTKREKEQKKEETDQKYNAQKNKLANVTLAYKKLSEADTLHEVEEGEDVEIKEELSPENRRFYEEQTKQGTYTITMARNSLRRLAGKVEEQKRSLILYGVSYQKEIEKNRKKIAEVDQAIRKVKGKVKNRTDQEEQLKTIIKRTKFHGRMLFTDLEAEPISKELQTISIAEIAAMGEKITEYKTAVIYFLLKKIEGTEEENKFVVNVKHTNDFRLLLFLSKHKTNLEFPTTQKLANEKIALLKERIENSEWNQGEACSKISCLFEVLLLSFNNSYQEEINNATEDNFIVVKRSRKPLRGLINPEDLDLGREEEKDDKTWFDNKEDFILKTIHTICGNDDEKFYACFEELFNRSLSEIPTQTTQIIYRALENRQVFSFRVSEVALLSINNIKEFIDIMGKAQKGIRETVRLSLWQEITSKNCIATKEKIEVLQKYNVNYQFKVHFEGLLPTLNEASVLLRSEMKTIRLRQLFDQMKPKKIFHGYVAITGAWDDAKKQEQYIINDLDCYGQLLDNPLEIELIQKWTNNIHTLVSEGKNYLRNIMLKIIGQEELQKKIKEFFDEDDISALEKTIIKYYYEQMHRDNRVELKNPKEEEVYYEKHTMKALGEHLNGLNIKRQLFNDFKEWQELRAIALDRPFLLIAEMERKIGTLFGYAEKQLENYMNNRATKGLKKVYQSYKRKN